MSHEHLSVYNISYVNNSNQFIYFFSIRMTHFDTRLKTTIFNFGKQFKKKNIFILFFIRFKNRNFIKFIYFFWLIGFLLLPSL